MSEENKTDSIKLKWSRLLLIGFCSLLLMYLFYIVGLKKLGVEDYADTLEWINSHFSLRMGVFLYAYIVDTLILPLSPDLVWVVGAGMVWWEAILLAGLGSALGGITSYGIGILVDKIPFIDRMVGKANKKWGPYIKAYGVPFVALSALFPLPFSTLCTAAGTIKLDFKKVVLASFLRIVHAGLYYCLFRAGLLLA